MAVGFALADAIAVVVNGAVEAVETVEGLTINGTPAAAEAADAAEADRTEPAVIACSCPFLRMKLVTGVEELEVADWFIGVVRDGFWWAILVVERNVWSG